MELFNVLFNFNNMRLVGLGDTSLDGEIVQMQDFNTDDLKIYIAHPTARSL